MALVVLHCRSQLQTDTKHRAASLGQQGLLRFGTTKRQAYTTQTFSVEVQSGTVVAV